MGSQRFAWLAIGLGFNACFHTVKVPGPVERRIVDTYDPMALPERTEPRPERWPSLDAPMIRTDVVVVDRAGEFSSSRPRRAR